MALTNAALFRMQARGKTKVKLLIILLLLSACSDAAIDCDAVERGKAKRVAC